MVHFSFPQCHVITLPLGLSSIYIQAPMDTIFSSESKNTQQLSSFHKVEEKLDCKVNFSSYKLINQGPESYCTHLLFIHKLPEA